MRRASLVAFAIYLGGSLAVGEVFPFSRYDMYARAKGRREGAALLVLADGSPTEIERWERFTGLEGSLLPPEIPCSMEYRVHETERWIARHRAQLQGPTRIQIGYRLISIDDGRLVERRRIVAEGTAWPR